MKLFWKPFASACLLWAGCAIESAWAQQQQPTTNAEVRIVTRTIDENGNVSEQETILHGQDALQHIQQQQSGQLPVPEGTMIEEEIEVIINDNGTGQKSYDQSGKKNHRIKITEEDGKGTVRIERNGQSETFDVNDLFKNKTTEMIVRRSNAAVGCDNNATDGVPRPALGVALEVKDGVTTIEEVMSGSAAQAAGLQKGDKILKMNGQSVSDIQTLQSLVRQQKVGDAVVIAYERDGKAQETTATLGAAQKQMNWQMREEHHRMLTPEEACKELEKMHQTPLLGVYIQAATSETNGAQVTGVIDKTGAAKAKLQEGDRIVQIDGTPVANYDELHATIQSYQAGDKVRVSFEREGRTMVTKATLSSTVERNPFKAQMLEQLCAQTQTAPAPDQSSDTPQSDDTQRIGTALVSSPATLEVFPNPVKDVLNVTFTGGQADQPIRLRLTQLDGKELLSEETTSSETTYQRQLDLAKLPAGAYLLTVTQGAVVLSKQVVVQR